MEFASPTPISEVRNRIRTYGATGTCYVRFYFADGTSIDSNTQYESGNGWIDGIYTNTNPSKLVDKYEVYLKINNGSYYVHEKDTSLRAYLANLNGVVETVSFNLPQYQEVNSLQFRLDITAGREDGDSIWFELVGDNNISKTYMGSDFGKLLPMPSEVPRPKKLRILLKAKTSSPTPGATALREVFWSTSNPKSHWTGTERIIRDNHYAEALENLGKRSFSTPDRRYSTVGFRLVQRP